MVKSASDNPDNPESQILDSIIQGRERLGTRLIENGHDVDDYELK